MDLKPGVERAIMDISIELSKLNRELERLNNNLEAPQRAKEGLEETLKDFRKSLMKTLGRDS